MKWFLPAIMLAFFLSGCGAGHKPAEACAKKAPSLLYINGKLWSVKFVPHVESDEEGTVGSAECDALAIKVSSLEPRQDQAMILVHEIEHAMTCKDGVMHNDLWNNVDGKHWGIYWSANQWLAVIDDNPDLVKWLQETREPATQDEQLFHAFGRIPGEQKPQAQSFVRKPN